MQFLLFVDMTTSYQALSSKTNFEEDTPSFGQLYSHRVSVAVYYTTRDKNRTIFLFYSIDK